MYAKFEKDFEILTQKAAELDDTKFPCKAKVAEITTAWDGIKNKDKEVETLRGATQDARFEVETITHRLKHYHTLCEVKDKRFKQIPDSNKTKKPITNAPNTFSLARFAEINKSDLSEDEFIHPQLKEENTTLFSYKNARINPRLKSKKTKKEDDTSDEALEEENAELKLCGTKCRVIPASIRTTFIHTMFDDYVRLQSGVAMTWNVLNKYNKLGYKGKLSCIEVEKEIGTVETEINEVNEKVAKITSQINQCTSQK